MNTRQPKVRGHKIPIPWRVYLFVGFITLIVVGAMTYILQQTKNISATHDPLLMHISEIKLTVTTAHLWFEEILSGDRNEKIETVEELLDYAEECLHALTVKEFHSDEHVRPDAVLDTRRDHGRFHISHDAHAFQNFKESLEVSDKKLDEFRDALKQRYKDRQTSGPGTKMDQRLDRIFAEFQKETNETIKQIRASKTHHLAEFRVIQTSLIFLCLVLAALIVVILHRFERQRADDFLAVLRSEEAFRKSEERYRLLFETMTSGFTLLEMIYDEKSKPVDCRYVAVNPSHQRHSGLNPSDIIGKTAKEVFGLKDEWIEKYGHVDKTGEPLEFEDYAEGLGKWFRVTAYRPKPGFVAETFENITDRKDAEESLRDSEEKYSNLFHQSNDAIIIHDLEGNILDANKKVLKQFGWSKSEILALKVPDLHPLKEHEKFLWAFEKIVQDGLVNSFEIDFVKKTGELFTSEVSSSLLEIGPQKVIQCIIRDITDRKKMESKLIQAQKMEAIGTLAGGIAHDFNNILYPIMGYVEIMLDDTVEDSQQRHRLNQVLKATKRAADLVKQILTFSRKTDQGFKLMKVQTVIKEVIKLSKSTLPSTIEIHQDICNNCGLIMADPTQIHQVAMNLVTNAYHAMGDEGGKLEVTLKEVELGAEDMKDPAMIPGPYVCLTVADTGAGMDRAIMDRIFDPYFTTKEKDKGTGLGLAVVHGIVKSYKGDIRVYSELGEGTALHVYLPVIDTQVETEKTEDIAPIQKGTERILLVDDEEPIVQMEKEVLEQLGYHVTARTSSIEALEAFRAAPANFDLVITDTTMPNMTGVQLSQKILSTRPNIPIVICTGFSEQIDDERAKIMGISGFVMKPVIRSELAKIIRRVLDNKKS